jgi:hypothetical protein
VSDTIPVLAFLRRQTVVLLQLELALVPSYLVRVASTGVTFGPRDDTGALLSASAVWDLALEQCVPEQRGLASAVGGHALFGVTSTEVQTLLAAQYPVPAPLSASRTPRQGMYSVDEGQC